MNETREKEMKIGSYIRTWHDTVAFGVTPVYARIVKINRVTVRVKTEYGDSAKVSKEFAQRYLLADGDWHPEID